MNPSVDLAFGVWTPNKLVNAAKKYMAATSSPAENALVTAYYKPPVVQAGVGDLDSAGTAAILGVLAVLLGLRVAAAWYVGKQIGRPVSGALVGGIFGAPGLGVLSLFSEVVPRRKLRPWLDLAEELDEQEKGK